MDITHIIWTKEAEVQYNNILLFWAENNDTPTYAIRLNQQVDSVLQTLLDFPKIGTICIKEKNIRRIVILRNFSLYYRIIESSNEIQVIAFLDNRSNPKKMSIFNE